MTCERCNRKIRNDAFVYDVAVCQTSAKEVEEETNEWEPQSETYICQVCYDEIFTWPMK